MHRPVFYIVASLLALGVCLLLLRSGGSTDTQVDQPIRLLCAASNRAVVEQIRDDFEAERRGKVVIEYGASGTLLSTIEVTGQGDLYLPADDSYLDLARERQLIGATIPLARMQIVLCVPLGNPLGIDSFDDLLEPDIRLVQAQPDAAAVGKVTRDILTRSGHWEALQANTQALRSTVIEVAGDVKLGAADVGIIYDVVLNSFPDLEAVRLPELDAGVSLVGVAVVKSSTQPEAAAEFARYLASPDHGQRRYAEFGFTPVGNRAAPPTQDKP